MGSRSHHSSPWALVLRSQCRTKCSMATVYRSAQGNCSNSEHQQGTMHTAARPSFVGRNFWAAFKKHRPQTEIRTALQTTLLAVQMKYYHQESSNSATWALFFFGYGSHVRNWTLTELNSSWWVINFWGGILYRTNKFAGFGISLCVRLPYAHCFVEPQSWELKFVMY